MQEEHVEISAEIRRFASVAPGLTDQERRARFLELVKRAHPDGSGSDELLRALIEAYEQNASVGRDVAASVGRDVAASVGRDMQTNERVIREVVASEVALLRRGEERAERREDSERVIRDVVRCHTSGLNQAKRQGRVISLTLGGIAGLIATLKMLGLDRVEATNAAGESIDQVWLTPTGRLGLFAVLALFSAATAVLAWRASVRAAWIEDAIEDAVATLDDKNRFLLTAREVVRDGDLGETWSHDELMEAVDYWTRTGGRSYRGGASARAHLQVLIGARRPLKSVPLRTLARIIGPSDFARLFIAKGLERELLAEEETTSPHGSRFYYRVR